jgi:hypothetical protein
MKDEFAVQNALEVALLAASVDAAEIPGFYKALMDHANVYGRSRVARARQN